MARTPRRQVVLPAELVSAARDAVPGGHDLDLSKLVRLGLAELAGVDIDEHTPRKTGRPHGARTRNRTQGATAA